MTGKIIYFFCFFCLMNIWLKKIDKKSTNITFICNIPIIICFIGTIFAYKWVSYAIFILPIYFFILYNIKNLMEKKRFLIPFIISGLVLGCVSIFSVNYFVKDIMQERIISEAKAKTVQDIDCILVLGAKVDENGPSPILSDRLEVGIKLYEKGIAPKIIMSGDHGRKGYDEVNAMKNYAKEKGLPSNVVFMDHAGFSTYDSIYRAKEIFKAQRIIIVTQEYHLYRSLYIAKCLGIEAYGVKADIRKHNGALNREIREILARDKDFIKTIFKPKPTVLGDEIPVSGDGDVTNDRKEYK